MRGKKVFLGIVLLLAFMGLSVGCGSTKELTPEDREADVTTVVKESLADTFGIEYSDFKVAHTSCSYIDSCETSDGMTSHYYLFQSAFEKAGVNHPVTARAYLVEEENKIYIVYITCDGESIYFDEETEDRMLDIG